MVSVGMGAGIGFAAQKWARIGVLIIGVWIGGLAGALLYSMLFHVFAGSNPMIALWICISFCGLGTAGLSMIYFDHAVIIGSSLAGAYIFGRVSMLNFIFLIGYFRVRGRLPQRVPSLSIVCNYKLGWL